MRDAILELARKYGDTLIGEFREGETYVPATAPLMNGDEAANLIDVALELPHKLELEGKFTKRFQRKLLDAHKNIMRSVRLTNSGSSANLLALHALTHPSLKDKRINKGDEVITVAAGFPTTVNPIIQIGAVPVFVDVELDTGTPSPTSIEMAVEEGKTKAVVIAHPLGNPFDLESIRDICDEFNIWLVEDDCDGLGGTYSGLPLGTFGDISTLSFYPAHHLCGGQAGAILTKSPHIDKIANSFRMWGKSCWCEPGQDNKCGRRFGFTCGELPEGYDHKYTYENIGYNLQGNEFSAALLDAQIDKLEYFTAMRRLNWKRLREGLDKYSKFFKFQKPQVHSEPAWFGFLITLKEPVPFTRLELVQFLEAHKVGTRLLFGGNLTKQPMYAGVEYKVFEDLYSTDVILRNSFWIGCHPSMKEEHVNYVLKVFDEFMGGHKW